MILVLLRITVGTILIVLGIAGFLVPFIPGWPAFFLGAGLIAPKEGRIFAKKIKKKFSEIWQKIKKHFQKKTN